MTCTTHHAACPCREHKITVLHKAALDGAFELKRISNIVAAASADEANQIMQTVERIYHSADALTMHSTDGSATEEDTHL